MTDQDQAQPITPELVATMAQSLSPAMKAGLALIVQCGEVAHLQARHSQSARALVRRGLALEIDPARPDAPPVEHGSGWGSFKLSPLGWRVWAFMEPLAMGAHDDQDDGKRALYLCAARIRRYSYGGHTKTAQAQALAHTLETRGDRWGETYVAQAGDTFAGEPLQPGTLVQWDASASTHYPAGMAPDQASPLAPPAKPVPTAGWRATGSVTPEMRPQAQAQNAGGECWGRAIPDPQTGHASDLVLTPAARGAYASHVTARRNGASCTFAWADGDTGKIHGPADQPQPEEDTSEEPSTDHGFDVCPHCGNSGVKVGPSGYVPCTRFLTCWSGQAQGEEPEDPAPQQAQASRGLTFEELEGPSDRVVVDCQPTPADPQASMVAHFQTQGWRIICRTTTPQEITLSDGRELVRISRNGATYRWQMRGPLREHDTLRMWGQNVTLSRDAWLGALEEDIRPDSALAARIVREIL